MADIVETAVSADMFNTLIKAVEAAGLVDLLKGEGPYTVFAPVDTAFERMPEGALDKLLQDIPRLKKILAYHVVSGDVRSDNLLEIDEAPTVEGSVLVIDSSKGYKVNQAIVLNPDMLADNGVIHAIDSVLMPAIMESTLVDWYPYPKLINVLKGSQRVEGAFISIYVTPKQAAKQLGVSVQTLRQWLNQENRSSENSEEIPAYFYAGGDYQ